MRTLRPAHERGQADHGWLRARYTFSFATYRDPAHHQFRVLRVMNEDRVAPGGGFAPHEHHDMEIVTYVLEGALEHRDSLGNGSILRAGEFQRMSAGSGIEHSEFNPSKTDPVHLYQIWLFPDRKGITPGYEQRGFPPGESAGKWRLVASPDGADGSLVIHQDARLALARLQPGEGLSYPLPPGRHAWLQVLRGGATVDGTPLATGDGLAVSDEPGLTLTADSPAELLLFDLP